MCINFCIFTGCTIGTLLLLIASQTLFKNLSNHYSDISTAVCVVLSISIGELCRIYGITQFNILSGVLFTNVLSICLTYSNSWKLTSISIAASMVYYFLRLSLHFGELPVNLVVLCLCCCVFYIANIIAFETHDKKDKDLVNKLSTVNVAMCRLVDQLPYAIYIAQDQKILYCNSQKLNEILQIDADEQGNADSISQIESKLKDTYFTIVNEEKEISRKCLFI